MRGFLVRLEHLPFILLCMNYKFWPLDPVRLDIQLLQFGDVVAELPPSL